MKRSRASAHYGDRRELKVHRELKPTPYDDAFWIFALWRALHGGDPELTDVAAAVIASLAQFLPAREDSFGLLPLPHSPTAAPEIADDSDESNAMHLHASSQNELFCDDPREFSIHHYYFNCNGVFYRLDRPVLACLPAAA
jgi:hypothetical protein